jgi:hypothetical protein
VGCGLFDPQAERDLEIRTDKTAYTVMDDSLRVFIKNTGNETVYYNECQLVRFFALMNDEIVEDSTLSAEFCFYSRTLATGQTITKNYAYNLIVPYAEQWALRNIQMNNFRLLFLFYVDRELDNTLPEEILTSNSFTLQYEVPFY